jgi:hypothetical protein
MSDTWNWSGARVKTEGQFANKTFSSVSATWIVPTLVGNPIRGERWYIASWVGLDGGSNIVGPTAASADLLQAGVYQTLNHGGHQECYAFCEWNVAGDSKYQRDNTLPAVKPGDNVSVTITVQFDNNGNATGASIQFNGVPIRIQKPGPAAFKGDTIEWVVERAAVNSNQHERLADIQGNAVEFNNAVGSTNGPNPMRVSPNVAEGAALNMEEDANPGKGHYICTATIPGPDRVHIQKVKQN